MNKEVVNRYIIFLFGLICLVLLILISFSLISTSQLLGQGEIVTYIYNYLNESQNNVYNDLSLLFELQELISPIQNIDIAISVVPDVRIEAGNILTSLNNLISNNIKIYLSIITTIEIIKYTIIISEIIAQWLFICVLSVGIIFTLFYFLSISYGLHISLYNQITKIVLIIFFILYIVFPYSIFTTSVFSEYVFQKDRIENRTMLYNLHNHIKATHIKEDIDTRAENSIYLLEKITLTLPYKTELMLRHYTKYIAISVLEFIFLPISLFLFLVSFLRWILKIEDE